MAIDLLERSSLDQLMAYEADVCVSIYLPMKRKGSDVRGNSVQLKNTLTEVTETLEERGWRKPDIDAFLEEPRQLLIDTEYWQHQDKGLVLFLSSDVYETYRLPLRFEPLTIVSERFHIKPLLPLFSDNGAYYVLALSQNKVRMFKGTRYSLEEVDGALMEAAGIPESIDEALAYDDPEEQLQHHTTTSGSVKGPEVVHHGHTVEDEREQRLRRFVQNVAKGVSNLLKGDETPVVVASVGYLHSLFEDMARLPNVMDDLIEGNPEHTPVETLRVDAWEIVAPSFTAAREQTSLRFKELSGDKKATDHLEEIIPAAFQGRIDALMVALDKHAWGHFDMATSEVVVHGSERSNGEDLLDYAAVHTLKNGGTVYVVEEQELPGDTAAAAILRY